MILKSLYEFGFEHQKYVRDAVQVYRGACFLKFSFTVYSSWEFSMKKIIYSKCRGCCFWYLMISHFRNHQRQVSVARLCKNGPVLFCCFLWHFKSKMPDSSSLFFSLCTLLLLIVSTHRLCYTHFLATSLFSALQLQGPWLCTSVPKGDIVEDEP